jgi:hypothetical protein
VRKSIDQFFVKPDNDSKSCFCFSRCHYLITLQ